MSFTEVTLVGINDFHLEMPVPPVQMGGAPPVTPVPEEPPLEWWARIFNWSVRGDWHTEGEAGMMVSGDIYQVAQYVAGSVTIEGDGISTSIVTMHMGNLTFTITNATAHDSGNETMMFTTSAMIDGSLMTANVIVIATDTGVDTYLQMPGGTTELIDHKDSN